MSTYREFDALELQQCGEQEYFIALLVLLSCEELHLVPSYYPAWN